MAGIKTDIRQLKSDLRKKYRLIKTSMKKSDKELFDDQISTRLINTKWYNKADILLCYVSTDIEIDTKKLIKQAFKDKKKVAVPICLNKKGKMDFYQIQSLTELKEGSFGILEPDLNTAKKINRYKNSICILPGFAFDKDGYRIGYGKGYYDRFLKEYDGIKIGLCYNSCIAGNLPHGRFDISADYIVTQKYVLTVKK